jgi:hypothetical protein
MRLLVGPVFTWHGNMGVWILLAGGLSVGALLFTTAAMRGDARDLQASATTV